MSIEINYKYNGKNYIIEYSESYNNWICKEVGITCQSLKDVKQEIEKSIKKKAQLQKQKLKKVCAYLDYYNMEKFIITSVVKETATYRSNNLSVWGIDEKGNREKHSIDGFCKQNEEIEKLLIEKDKIEKKIKEFRKNNAYTPKELIKDMGYSAEYALEEFGIDINKEGEEE